MVLDPTILVDGEKLWDSGKLLPSNFPATRAVIEQWTELKDLFDAPAGSIGC